MATGAELFRQNADLIYSTYRTEFNNILGFLIEQEQVSPGTMTAMIDDIARQETSIREGRLELERLRRAGQKEDASLMQALKEVEMRGATAYMQAQTQASIARGDLRTALSKEMMSQKEKGTSAFTSQTNSKEAKKKFNTPVTIPAVKNITYAKKELEKEAAEYTEILIKGREGLEADPVGYAQYNEKMETAVRDFVRSRVAPGTGLETALGWDGTGTAATSQVDKNKVYDEVLANAFDQAGHAETAGVARAERKAKTELENIAKSVGAGKDPTDDLNARAMALGVDKDQLSVLAKAASAADEQDAGADIIRRAAYHSSKLPGSEFAYGTLAEYEAALAQGDEEALELYNLTLTKPPSFIQLLSGGEYTARMANLGEAEKALQARRDDAAKMKAGLSDTDYRDIYANARRIYSSLFGRAGKLDARARAKEAREAVKGNKELADAVGDIAEEEGQTRLAASAIRRALYEDDTLPDGEDDVDLNLSRRQQKEWEDALPAETTWATNDRGERVFKDSGRTLADATLTDLQRAMMPTIALRRPTLAPQVAKAFEDIKKASPQRKREFATRLTSGLSHYTKLTDEERDAMVPQTPTPAPPPATAPSPKPAPPPALGPGSHNLGDPRTPKGASIQSTREQLTALGETGATVANEVIRESTFNNSLSQSEYDLANKDSVAGMATELGIPQTSIDNVNAELEALEELGRIAQGKPTPSQLSDIVPTAKYDEGALTYAAAVARNAHDRVS